MNLPVKYLLILSFMFSQHQKLLGEDINFSTLGLKEGLSQLSVHTIYQDELGFMWFGTRQGLNRYNGDYVEQIRIFPEPPAMTDHTVWSIYGDKKGSLYILADRSLLRYDLRLQSFETLTDGIVDYAFYHDDRIYLVSKNQVYILNLVTKELLPWVTLENRHLPVKQILFSQQGAIWLATRAGLVKLTREGRIEKVFFNQEQITALKEDSQRTLWVGTRENGAIRFNPHNETNIKFLNEFINNEVRCFEEDENGDIWVGTFRGLFRFDKDSGLKGHYQPVDNLPNRLSHSSVYSLLRDVQGTIWVGTYFGGVNFFNPGKDIFRQYISSSYHPDHLSFPIVGNMTEDKEGNLWILTEGGGLNRLNRLTQEVSVFKNDEKPGSIAHNNLKHIWYDEVSGKLYIGTHLGGLSVMDTKTGKFTNYRAVPGDSTSLPNNVVNRIFPYKEELLLATQNGIASINRNTGLISSEFRLFRSHFQISDPSIWEIHIDAKDRLWIAYFNSGLIRYDLKTLELKSYKYSHSTEGSVPRYRVTDIFEDSRNHLFFSTDGSGVLKYVEATDSFESYTESVNGLLSDFCFKIAESPSGKLIITSNKGISFLDLESGKVRNIQVSKSVPLSGIIEENGIFVARDGEIFIGGIDGMVSFQEKDLDYWPSSHGLYFSKLYVNNQFIIPHDDTEILSASLPYTNEIELKHGQSNLVFEFASTNYIRHKGNEFEYRLTGLDNGWMKAQGRSVVYTHLRPGSYMLQVRESGFTESDNPKLAEIRIRVRPAWYASNLAFVFYGLFVLGFLVGFVVFDRNRTLLKASLDFERKEKLRIEELNQSKLRFFTNISHEFRTPLTLIISLVEMVAQNPSLPRAVISQISRIQKQAVRMRHLVNELLDFRKQEQGHLKLKVQNLDIVEFLKDIFLSFEDYAYSREIKFSFENPGTPLQLWIDPVQMQKVFINLLSNAFKFTRPGDAIKVRLIQKMNSVVIKIIDSGKGIPVEELNRIFDRFYQAENISSDHAMMMSSGIGLALTKGIVELHGGKIAVESSEGEGSTFRVELPAGDSHFTPDQKMTTFPADLHDIKSLIIPESEFIEKLKIENSPGDSKPVILIVEDNEDVLQVLIDLFNPLYTVETASNGEEGFQKALEIAPDIVLSDVMMSKMTGREMCRKIKSQYEIAHIPVVLLTSQNSPEQITEGLMHGADDYVTKPFDAKVLIIRCNNLINSRRILRQRFSSMLSQTTPVLAVNSSGQELLRKIDQVIEKNLGNSDFNIDHLARETGMGRSKLYSEVREITGITPNTYILNYKMQKAAEWLRIHPGSTVSEIAYQLGFNTARYFSLCFKDHYGISPNEYRKKLSGNSS